MAERTFVIGYDGPALGAGRMDVREIAPALISLADLLQEAHRELNPQDAPVAVEVTATQEGSFEVHLILSHRLLEQVVNVFASDPAAAAANLSALVSAVRGLLRLLKGLRGKSIRQQELQPTGDIRLTLDDQTTIEIPAASLDLSRKLTVRKHVRRVLQPLGSEGIDRFFVREEGTEVSILSEELPAFDVPELPPTPIGSNTVEMVLSIVSAAFVEGNKWRFSAGEGQTPFYAAIEDSHFLALVEAGEAFSKHDLLRVRLRTVQERGPDGTLHTEYAVENVLAHEVYNPEVPLPFDEGTAGTQPESAE